MEYKYFPHTESEIKEMLDIVGVGSLDELYSDVPEEIRFKKEYDLPEAMSEMEVRRFFEALGNENKRLVCFAGAGVYDHYTPAVVGRIVQRSEFLTSYTPYQAEISQGTLHYIFEYQSMMAELTGMDISNASMYDGSTATAEAMMMAVAAGKKCDTVLVSETVDKKVLTVVKTYAKFHGVNIVMVKENDGITDKADFQEKIAQKGVAGVIVQQPNRYGIVEDYAGYADAAHDNKALMIMNGVAADYAVLKTPAEWGADIAVGDGQSLGVPMMFGGPYVGYMCCTEKLIRKMPGRIVGMTKDKPRTACLRAHIAGQRAAYPPAEGYIQHMLQPEPHGSFRYRIHGGDGKEGSEGSWRTAVCRSSLHDGQTRGDGTFQTNVPETVLQ